MPAWKRKAEADGKSKRGKQDGAIEMKHPCYVIHHHQRARDSTLFLGRHDGWQRCGTAMSHPHPTTPTRPRAIHCATHPDGTPRLNQESIGHPSALLLTHIVYTGLAAPVHHGRSAPRLSHQPPLA